jgi:kinetochore protein Nuf2
MGTSAIEDKRTVTLHEGKARDLQAKITALFKIEKVCSTPSLDDY